MEEYSNNFIWSDHWWVEDHEAWFVDGRFNLLCCINMDTDECNIIARVPDNSELRFRANPRCIKSGNDIYCMPHYGNSIWIYDMSTGNFSEIIISNPKNVALCICDFWKYGHYIYAVSAGLKAVIEFSVRTRKIENLYTICDEGNITKSVMAGDNIYILIQDRGTVCRFCVCDKSFHVLHIPGIRERMYTLCIDDDKFWMSGYKKEIYVWKKNDTAFAIDDFPSDFGIYNFESNTDGRAECLTAEYETPTFLFSVIAGNYIWFIPFQTNQILYVDKVTYKVHVFEIEEENETRESLLGRLLNDKYSLEYVRNNRYIGIFSHKNGVLLEIDALNISFHYRRITVAGDQCRKYAGVCNNVFYESVAWERSVYRKMLDAKECDAVEQQNNFSGSVIYNYLR